MVLTDKERGIAAKKSALKRAERANKGIAAQRETARKHAALIDAIVLNGADFIVKDNALRKAAKLLRQLSKG